MFIHISVSNDKNFHNFLVRHKVCNSEDAVKITKTVTNRYKIDWITFPPNNHLLCQ